ncbi:uncharacterized protein B0H18DRAFT_1122321 [Fomitopsis serialis]|uniref:uncharacterized protein n=1 Tax=Fomitopsis serialis TaxID=139415 RepID=UPI0020084B8C|nr:uncharacterized protein B0H18DRAFT_1122321 [Neoantrodia serialis]KAH9919671.1 hypothetical protein B0H18DRAFT_1122321 [Neoantrodia serialis]
MAPWKEQVTKWDTAKVAKRRPRWTKPKRPTKDLDPAIPRPKLSDFVAAANGTIDADEILDTDDDEDGESGVGQDSSDSEGDAAEHSDDD